MNPAIQRILGSDVLDPDKLEEHLVELVFWTNPADVERLGIQTLVLDLNAYVHNDDVHHSGETVLEHIRWVVEDVPKVRSRADLQIMNLTAILHDLGKAYTYEIIDGKHTFRKHAGVSVQIAQAMLKSIEGTDLHHRTIDVVRHHDAFMKLIDARRHSEGKLRYLNKFMRTDLCKSHLIDLVEFSHADGFRANRVRETLEGMDMVLKDMQVVQRQRRQEEELKARRKQPTPRVVDAVRRVLSRECPELESLLPDVRAVKRQLGQDGKFKALAQIEKAERA